MAKKIKKTDGQQKNAPFYISDKDISNYSLPEENVVYEKTTASKFNASEMSKLRSLASVSLQSGFNRHDRLLQRPEETMPTGHKDIIALAQAFYRKIGVVRNIIDLMSDFASEGLELKHPVKYQERFYKAWAKKVDLASRAHDWMKLFLRDANVVVRKKNAIISKPIEKQIVKADLDVPGLTSVREVLTREKPEKLKIEKKGRKREIPWRYIFISPTVLEKIGGEAGRFYGGDRLAVRLTPQLRRSILHPKTNAEKDFIKKLPTEILSAVKNSRDKDTLIALDPEKVYIDYYKKDDWEDWGTPFLYGVFEDILLKDKMKQADTAALDGVINVTRIWKLGDHKEKIFPTPTAANKLINILQHNVGGGIKNIVWDSMITMDVDYPPVDKILGDAKYKAVNSDILKGLGIPEALVGGVDLATRNAETAFVQLKTLIERLEYARQRCIKWIEGELAIVGDAMGFKTIPSVMFGTMSLRDEAREKQLMIQLADRGLISIQAIHDVFGTDFVTELERIKEEQSIRDKDPKILEKSNPYNRPVTQLELQHEFRIQLEKVKQGLNRFTTLPDLNDVDLRGGDNPNGDQPRDSGDNDPGRPPNQQDTLPRDERRDQILSVYKIKAEEHLASIDRIIDPLYLKHRNIKNMRELTKVQMSELEKMKFSILATISFGDKVTQELINQKSSKKFLNLVNVFQKALNKSFLGHAEILGRSPRLLERRSLATSTWAFLHCG